MDEIYNDGFYIDSPAKADWAIRKIKEERERRDLYIDAANSEIDDLNHKIELAQEKCDKNTEYLLFLLNQYLDTVPAKKANTQMSFDLPSGKLIRKFAKRDFSRDDKTLLNYLRDSCPEYIRTKQEINWEDLKKDITIESNMVVRKSTGEIIPGISIVEKSEKFDIK